MMKLFKGNTHIMTAADCPEASTCGNFHRGRTRIRIAAFFAVCLFMLFGMLTGRQAKAEDSTPQLAYSVHVQNIGWQQYVQSGQLSGTTGRSLRLEGIKIRLDNAAAYNGSIEYRTHVQDIGWEQNWAGSDGVSGTTGRSKRLEAIQIRLTGELADKYDIYYCVHAQDYGWLNWAKNGACAGTAGYGKRLEAIEIVLTNKGASAPAPLSGANQLSYVYPVISSQVHVQNDGWQGYVNAGGTSGTTGRSLRLEGIKIRLNNASYMDSTSGNVLYQTHIQNIGWESTWRSNGQLSGTTGRSLRLEAIRIKLDGDIANQYDIYYRVHAENFGWLGWAKNGEAAGTAGYSYRLEAIQIRTVPKGAAAPGGGSAFYSLTTGTPTANPTGKLSVSGNRLTDASGNTVQLRGVSTHGIAWYPQYVNEDAFRTLRDTWNVNLIRLAMYPQEYNGYLTGGNQAQLEQLIDRGVQATNKLGMYCIIDWHILSDGNPLTHQQQAIEFFRKMSSKYAGYNNAIYEICNEPNGGVSWSTIRQYANNVIPVIRQYSPDAIILVGTPNWSQDVDQVASAPVANPHNVMYTCHFYAATHKDSYRTKVETALRQGTPVFISEFSICDASGNGGIDYSSANAWKNLINKYGLSYAGWSLSNKSETSALIRSNCSKTSGWTDADLTDTGKYLKNMCQGH